VYADFLPDQFHLCSEAAGMRESILLLKIRSGGRKMTPARISLSMRAISLLIAVCLAGFPAEARHGGGGVYRWRN